MLKIKEIELNSDGNIVSMKGTYEKHRFYHFITDRALFWAEFNLDYCGG